MSKNIYLIKGLQAMLMIIPQGESFDLLKNRVKCVSYFSNINSGMSNPTQIEKDTEINLKNEEYRNLYSEISS